MTASVQLSQTPSDEYVSTSDAAEAWRIQNALAQTQGFGEVVFDDATDEANEFVADLVRGAE
jgi:hypothetical protein